MRRLVIMMAVSGMVSFASAAYTTTGLQLHLEADSVGLSDGDTVSAWADLSGNGNDASSTGTPTYVASDPDLFGHASVQIQGSLTLDGSTWTGNDDDWFSLTNTVHDIKTITMVMRRTSNVYYSWSPMFGSEPTGWTDEAFHGDNNWGTAFCSNNYADPAVYYGDLRVNGLSQGSAGWAGVPTDYSVLTLVIQDGWGSDVNINQIASSINNSHVWGMDIAELMVYDQFLSSTDLDGVEAYLMNKYIVPEPATMVLLGLGGCLLRFRKTK